MKRVVLAIALLGSSAMAAQAAFVTWQGDIFIKTATPDCVANVGIGEGSFFRASYTPANLGTNGADTRMIWLSTRSALAYRKVSAAYGNGTWEAFTFGSHAQVGGPFNVNVTTARSQPLAPTATTQTIVLSGKIANFFNVSTCTVTFIGSLGLRVD